MSQFDGYLNIKKVCSRPLIQTSTNRGARRTVQLTAIPMKNRSLACVLGLTCVLLAGCLTTVPKIDAQHSASVQTRQLIANGIQAPTIDANGNLVTPWVRDSMISAFYMRAAHLGIKINPNGIPVTIHITSVRSRSETARAFANFFDGADHLSGVVSVGMLALRLRKTRG